MMLTVASMLPLDRNTNSILNCPVKGVIETGHDFDDNGDEY